MNFELKFQKARVEKMNEIVEILKTKDPDENPMPVLDT